MDALSRDYARYNTQYPAQEVIQGMLWDTATYTSGTTVAANFFNAVRATLDLGNMEIPSQLPNPKAFLVRAINFYVKNRPWSAARGASTAVTTGQADNIQQLINTGVLRLTIGSKIYAEFPLWALPSGAGAYGNAGLDGNTADPGIVVDHAVSGFPDVSNSFTLSKPLFIAPQINFVVTVTWPAAITLTGNLNITVNMEGDLIRPAQ